MCGLPERGELRRADRGNMRSCQERGDLLSGILIHGFICIRAQALHLMIQQKISPIHRTWQSHNGKFIKLTVSNKFNCLLPQLNTFLC